MPIEMADIIYPRSRLSPIIHIASFVILRRAAGLVKGWTKSACLLSEAGGFLGRLYWTWKRVIWLKVRAAFGRTEPVVVGRRFSVWSDSPTTMT